jgi:D-alanyl-D-alanine carboxypeptidase
MQKTPRDKPYDSDSTHGPDSPRRRYHSKISRRPRKDFYSDEHPEIPKVRRASLYYLGTSKSPRSSTARRARPPETPRLPPTTPYLDDEEQDTYSPSSNTGHSRVRKGTTHISSPSRRPARTVRVEEEAYERDEVDEPASAVVSTGKIIVTQHRHPAIYEPPVRTRPPSRGRRSKPLKPDPAIRWRDFAQRHSLLLVGLSMVLLLLIAPLVAPAALNNLHPLKNAVNTVVGQTYTNAANTKANVPGTDPHQIVIVPPSNSDHPSPPVYATSAYLLDADTGATLYARNPFVHLPMLSTTKLMTALIAAQEGNPDQKITITDAIARDINGLAADSSLMGIKKGETYTLRELLYGLLLVSGNDAAIAIADGLDGNLQTFVTKMNEHAQQLGLHDTHYMNPHGLLAQDHYSSAHDLAVLGKYSLSIPLINQISGTREYHLLKTATHAEHVLVNGNQFLWWYPGVDAGKPGWDGANDFNQVISCIRNHHHLIGVVMNTKDWWTDMRDLMNWGFNTFQWISPAVVDMTNPIPFDADWNFFVRDKKENTITTADKGRYYVYTGYSVSNPILAYFDKGGGLKKFGYPTGMPKSGTGTAIKQQFEHAVIQCDIQSKQCSTV